MTERNCLINSNMVNNKFAKEIAFLCIIGFILCLYALSVEIEAKKNEDYKAFCDISENISCTSVFKSKYGTGFGLIAPIFGEDSILNQPNSIGGIVFYLICIILVSTKTNLASQILLWIAAISNIMSIYLGYLLYFVLEDMCIVCISTYVVNFLILILSMLRRKSLRNRIITKKD